MKLWLKRIFALIHIGGSVLLLVALIYIGFSSYMRNTHPAMGDAEGVFKRACTGQGGHWTVRFAVNGSYFALYCLDTEHKEAELNPVFKGDSEPKREPPTCRDFYSPVPDGFQHHYWDKLPRKGRS